MACSRRRWKLAVTCACVVCHCACVLALPMGAIPSGGLHLLGRIARDQLGLNLPDRVFRLIGNKPRLGAGRPSSPCHCRRRPSGVYWRLALHAPVQQGPVSVGDSPPVFIGAPPYTRPQCRPPRRTMASMGVMAQMLCDAGDSGTQFTSATPPHPGLDGGFCSIRRVLSACRRRVAPLMVQFPPFGGAVIGRHVTHGSS